ncbi:phage tail family protein [Fictibacillus sp. 5RED26]|uniref:phage tail family protein n=1 Tax=Fictibacillus sp. 5RED26 TaxID=2745876 RepID=UPI0018CD1B37|nr:phage tail family protein [Fictibacillus sp. 5RED26]
MRIKEILCTNKNGDSLLISKQGSFKLQEDIDTSGVKANVTYVSNYQSHGAIPVASRLDKRDLSLQFYIDVQDRSQEWIQDRRDELFIVFNPVHNPLRLEIKTEVRSVFIDANIELSPSINPDPEHTNEGWHNVLVQLTAGNPFFQSTEVNKVEIAVWNSLFEFPFEIPSEGLEMGQRSPSLIVNVLNNGQVETGMIIKFKAIGSVLNPSLFNVNTREYIKLNRLMSPGETITINTNKSRKRIESSLNGVKSNIFNTIEFGSKFMQLATGDNLFRYDADENLENLEVSIYFSTQYLGV